MSITPHVRNPFEKARQAISVILCAAFALVPTSWAAMAVLASWGLLLALAITPGVVLAQDAGGGALPAFLQQLLANPDTWAWIIIALVSLFGLWRREQARKVNDALKTWVPIAYDAVNELARRTDTKVDDKAAAFLQKLAELLEADGVELTDAVKAKALAAVDHLHYREKTGQAIPAGPTAPSPTS